MRGQSALFLALLVSVVNIGRSQKGKAEDCELDGSSAIMNVDEEGDEEFVVVTSNGCASHYVDP